MTAVAEIVTFGRKNLIYFCISVIIMKTAGEI